MKLRLIVLGSLIQSDCDAEDVFIYFELFQSKDHSVVSFVLRISNFTNQDFSPSKGPFVFD